MKSVFDNLFTDEAKKFIESNQNVIRSLKKQRVKTIAASVVHLIIVWTNHKLAFTPKAKQTKVLKNLTSN